MTDFLIVSFDKDEKTNEIGICVARQTKTNILIRQFIKLGKLKWR